MTHLPTRGQGIVLIGYRATGKSSVGRILAERLSRPFADSDREVEARTGFPVRSIFARYGEAAFRDREAWVLADLVARKSGGVIATGGGAILLEANRRALREFGFVVWLTADADTLTRRLQSSHRGVFDRPALTTSGTLGEVAEVLEFRTPLYREIAHAEVSTVGRNVEQVAEAVLEALNLATEGHGRNTERERKERIIY